MKRYGKLFEQVVSFDNLLLAAKKALRGHKDSIAAARFYFHLETEIFCLQEELIARLRATGHVQGFIPR